MKSPLEEKKEKNSFLMNIKFKPWSVLSRPKLAIKSETIVMNDRAIPTEINTNETLGIFGDETFFF